MKWNERAKCQPTKRRSQSTIKIFEGKTVKPFCQTLLVNLRKKLKLKGFKS